MGVNRDKSADSRFAASRSRRVPAPRASELERSLVLKLLMPNERDRRRLDAVDQKLDDAVRLKRPGLLIQDVGREDANGKRRRFSDELAHAPARKDEEGRIEVAPIS